jgi:multimeric flavodoxin WrbA/nitrite reductase/ring-hydroxylating ferredoxin subunit
MAGENWHDIGPVEQFAARALTQVSVGRTKLAVSCVNGAIGVVSGVCNHVGGPLGEGALSGEYVVCPWHHWKFHRVTGQGEQGFEADAVPRYDHRVDAGRLLVNLTAATKRSKLPHEPHPVAREVARAEGPVRVLGISTTAMDEEYPRYSTSDDLLDHALTHARGTGCETQLVRLSALRVRPCEGYYSKSAHACTWPCSITQMDPSDEMAAVYEGVVHWADAILVASPIRWGSASALYFKMIERMNCIQNQITLRNRVLLRNTVASFIITGGQDNVQGVAGQMLGFFAELGCVFPQFPYVAHTRGWSAEDMENNVAYVRQSASLREGTRELVDRAVAMSRVLIASECEPRTIARGGRKAFREASE